MTAAALQVPARLSALLAAPAPPVRRLRTPVAGISWVRPEPGLVRELPVGTSAAALEGLRFERAVGKSLRPLAAGWDAILHSGLWLRFHSQTTGLDWAQPDHFLVLDDRVLLLECKRTQTPEAWHQLAHVYLPLLDWLYPELLIVPVQVAHYLREPEPNTRRLDSLRELVEADEDDLAELASWRLLLHCHDPRRLS